MSAERPPGWHFWRAVFLAYSAAVLGFVIGVFLLLPIIQLVVTRLTRRRADPWWPVTRWMLFISTLPRMATWVERRLEAAPRRVTR